MNRVPDAPADTRMMGIVHDALRRDLTRAIEVLTTTRHPEGMQPAALGEHVRWMMAFLESHHRGEDAGLWPLVRDRDPGVAPLVDALEADHARIAPCVAACDAAAHEYERGATDPARAALLDALERLREVLLPHLRREEDEAMPAVSLALTAAELRDVERRYFIEPKSQAQLGFEGHWLMDGLDAERRRIVLHQVPPVARLVLLYGFARRYRRRATAAWGRDTTAGRARRKAYGPAPALPPDLPRAGRVEALVPAPVDAVWAVAADVSRVGEWSHECRRVDWLDGAAEAAPGVRFRGTNRAGPWRWSRINEVIVADPPHTFVWRTVPTALFPDSTEWRLDLEATDGGTRIVQSYQVLRAPAVLARIYAIAVPTHRGRSTGLADDLRRLGEVALHRAPDTVLLGPRHGS